ncbi:MAG TPA: hypothetical protein VD997_06930 [Phycisphaerales bacterium]|nr:hypothetical protein [Phycisphaerales bacterium]
MIQETVQFEQEYKRAVGELRGALIQLFDAIGVDPAAPQEVARRLGINKTLTWNVSRVIRATDEFGALAHIPGEQALGKLLEAAGAQGAGEESVQAVRTAARSFREMTALHVGDRSSLDIVVDSMAPTSEAIEHSRKLAFRGNSGLYGVQARTRFVSTMVVPNAEDASRLDVAFLSGFVGFRRLRADVRWPIFKVRLQSRPESIVDLFDPGTPVEVGSGARPRFYAKGQPPRVEVVQSKGDHDYVLMPGAVGDTAAFDCFKGEVFRAAVPRYQQHAGETGDFGASITVPAEHLVLDLIVHQDLAFALEAKVMVFSTIYGHGEADRRSDDISLLPITQTPLPLVGSPPAVATARVPRYSEFFRTMHECLKVDPRQLRGIRVEMKYPPLGSMVVLRYGVPVRA